MCIVKNPKDYIQETSTNVRTVTSLAYWLTAEGLDNPIYAALLREAINNSSNEDFAEAFDGATKEEATHFLASWELCYMPLWGAPELSKAIVLSDEGRSEELALRAVNMAQSVDELPDVFTPAIGIKWAMDRGYLIDNSICTWVGVAGGSYGHPHNQIKSVTGDAPENQAEIVTNKTGVKWTLEKLAELNQFYLNEKNVKKTRAFKKATADHYGVTPKRIEQLLEKYKEKKPSGLGLLVSQTLMASHPKK